MTSHKLFKAIALLQWRYATDCVGRSHLQHNYNLEYISKFCVLNDVLNKSQQFYVKSSDFMLSLGFSFMITRKKIKTLRSCIKISCYNN